MPGLLRVHRTGHKRPIWSRGGVAEPRRLPTGLSDSADCDALPRKDRHGVGKLHAHDHTTGTPVTNFYRSTRLYNIAMIATSTGGKHNPSNLRRDVLRPAVEAANAKLTESGIAAIDEQLGFHGLRRSYASLRCACGDDPAYTSAQIGHTDPRFTLRCYTRATRRRERLSGPHLRAYDRALEWARMGTIAVPEAEAIPTKAAKNPA